MVAEHVIVTSTTDSEAAAGELAARVIEERLGACAQVVGPVTSVYRWEGEVRTDREWRVEVKTTAGRVAALAERIKQLHGYDLPEVIATPIEGGSAEYLAWVTTESGNGG
ncbi:divalent-cation tolerance protein CutA [Amycolatopsis australiensis]|uniref:Divalent cation tolerance protein n=1 Tax=Amycolatopsis australiensis TaxID=546364 RepID=A0A1K1S919_9PSEU|nr:divalent-cation tolerance protein CutA [Amycolatopsis australiensis]SFW80881.1 divalent cation tolerance protein [Amycolatopsis australiensis]